MLNPMCEDCVCLNVDCKGTTCQVWTDCIYKVRKQEKQEQKKENSKN